MRRTEPAVLYTVHASARTMAELAEALLAAGLFCYDHFDEAHDGHELSVRSRPQLARALADARLGAAGEGDGPRVLVTDAIENLGVTPVERAAVVSALLQLGCEVRIHELVLDQRWYQRQVSSLGFSSIDDVAGELLDVERFQETIQTWFDEVGLERWVPSATGRHGPAQDRIRELIEVEGLSFTAAAKRLTAEGYPNERGVPVWYPQNVAKGMERNDESSATSPAASFAAASGTNGGDPQPACRESR